MSPEISFKEAALQLRSQRPDSGNHLPPPPPPTTTHHHPTPTSPTLPYALDTHAVSGYFNSLGVAMSLFNPPLLYFPPLSCLLPKRERRANLSASNNSNNKNIVTPVPDSSYTTEFICFMLISYIMPPILDKSFCLH